MLSWLLPHDIFLLSLLSSLFPSIPATSTWEPPVPLFPSTTKSPALAFYWRFKLGRRFTLYDSSTNDLPVFECVEPLLEEPVLALEYKHHQANPLHICRANMNHLRSFHRTWPNRSQFDSYGNNSPWAVIQSPVRGQPVMHEIGVTTGWGSDSSGGRR